MDKMEEEVLTKDDDSTFEDVDNMMSPVSSSSSADDNDDRRSSRGRSSRFKTSGSAGATSSPEVPDKKKEADKFGEPGGDGGKAVDRDYVAGLNRILDRARFFLMKSDNVENVDLAKSLRVWSAPREAEELLDQAFTVTRNVILIFSVNGSGKFSGFARLATESQRGKEKPKVNWVVPARVPMGALLGGVFHIDWISTGALSFVNTSHLFNPWNECKPVKVGRNGQEIEPNVGEALCRLFPVDSKTDWNVVLKRSKDAAGTVVESKVGAPLGSRGAGRVMSPVGGSPVAMIGRRGRGNSRGGFPAYDDYAQRSTKGSTNATDHYNYQPPMYSDRSREGMTPQPPYRMAPSQGYHADYTPAWNYQRTPPPMAPYAYPPPPPFNSLPPPPPRYYEGPPMPTAAFPTRRNEFQPQFPPSRNQTNFPGRRMGPGSGSRRHE